MTTAPEAPAAPARRRTGFTIVDTDIHPACPPAELMPRLDPAARRRYELFGSRVPAPPDVYPRVRNSGYRLDAWPEGAFPGSDLQLVRDQLLDEFDIDHGVLIPLQSHSWGAETPEFAASLCRALNDWVAECWLDREPRLRSSIAVSLESPELAAAEIRRRSGDPRFCQVLLATGGESGFGRRRYWPIYAAAAEAGLPIAAHTGGLEQHRGAGWPSFYLEEHVWNGNMMGALVTSLLCEGVLTEFPELQVVCVEGGLAWAAPLIWSLDDGWAALREDVPHLDRPPSEILREHLWFTTQPIEEPRDPADLATVIRHLGLGERIMFASDYPHWDFDSPTSAPRLFPADLREPIMGSNACRLYGLPERVAA
ncbi:amidohydrolase family protein [Pseudonocardia sp. TMWB2A]|uniref:amidohydrolase family protein n=1 Tax=Pseudonocardia sp. TMWB2A TaxID=687430 RepID=UPI00307ED44B